MITVAVVGCGYWGPNLIRNFMACPYTELMWACDKDKNRLNKVLSSYPSVKPTDKLEDILNDDTVDSIAIATPVHSHYEIASICLKKGKHVLLEKPLASNVKQGEELVRLASERGLQLMCDHTFCYNGAVRKMHEIINSGILGEILYFDSVRINLGLFQHDVNVIWDLAVHDLSILDYLIQEKPIKVSAYGVSHSGNNIENIAYVVLQYQNDFIAHFHVNWLSPVKIRKTIIGGSQKMLVWNDLESAEKIKVYDKGIDINNGEKEKISQALVSYRTGDIWAPHVDATESLALVVKEFEESITQNRPAITDGNAALRVLKILEATEKSIKSDGKMVFIEY